MKIGLAGWILAFGPSGVGRRIEALAEAALSGGEEVTLFLPSGGAPFSLPPGAESRAVTIPHTPTWKRVYLESRHLPALARERGLSLFHLPTAPVPALPVPATADVHDLRDFTRWARPGRRFLAPFLWRRSLGRARLLLAVSRTTGEELARRIPSLAGRVRVVPTGIPSRFFSPPPARPLPSGLEDGYILHLGRPLPHKNLGLLLSAYRILLSRRPRTPPLVLAGISPGPEGSRLREEIRRLGLEGRALWIGALEEEEARALLARAGLAVFPSLYEGQGLAPLEALASGVPVAASNIPAHREFLGGSAPLFDPADPEGLADLMAERLGDRSAAPAGKERARTLDSFSMAGPLLEAWREAADG